LLASVTDSKVTAKGSFASGGPIVVTVALFKLNNQTLQELL